MNKKANKTKSKTTRESRQIRLCSSIAAGILALSIAGGGATTAHAAWRTSSSDYENNSLHNYENTDTYSTAAESASIMRSGKINYNLPGVYSKSVSSYSPITISLNGSTLSYKGREINGIAYLPVRQLTDTAAPSVGVSYSSSSRALTLSGGGLYMTVSDGAFVSYANDRPLFAFSPAVILSDGRMYLPTSVITKALGLSFSRNGGSVSLYGSFKALTPASGYYRSDEVYWLSKIISAESSGEMLLGQIAVGDVILNRVHSPLYPSTIYGVIFDKRYGVQFSPTADGRIYGTPTYTATLAAKICLEGISLSDDAMYFLNPRAAQSSWIVKNRPYAYTIGNHDFYL